jgi:hypothetical protein
MRCIIGLAGKKRAGKDTVGEYLVKRYGFTRVSFADEIRSMLEEINPYTVTDQGFTQKLRSRVEQIGWEAAKDEMDNRRLMRDLGVALRSRRPSFWIDLAIDKLTRLPAEAPVVFTDVRYENEAQMISDVAGWVVLIRRPKADLLDTHVSETELDDYPFQYIIENTGGLADLGDAVDLLLKQLDRQSLEPFFCVDRKFDPWPTF